jgi:hypothetical protein
MRWILVLVVWVVGCVPADTVRVKRWPTHRQERDTRMEKLEHDLEAVIEHVAKLETELAAARAQPNVVTPPVPARSDTPAPASTSATP